MNFRFDSQLSRAVVPSAGVVPLRLLDVLPRAIIVSTFTNCSIMFRRYHDPEASLEEGLATLRRCIDEVSKRLVVSPGKYKVKVVDKDGVRELEL